MGPYLMPCLARVSMNRFTVDELKKIVAACLGGDTAAELTEANLTRRGVAHGDVCRRQQFTAGAVVAGPA
jgi:hypothetical protein